MAGLLDLVGTDITGQARYRPHDLVGLFASELYEQDDHDGFRRYLNELLGLSGRAYARVNRVNEGLPPSRLPSDPDPALVGLVADPDAWVHTERAQLLHAIELACRLGWHEDAAVLADLVIPALAVRGGFEQLQRARAVVRDAAFAAGDELVAYRAETSRGDILLSQRIGEASAAFAACVPAFRRLGLARELVHSLTGLAFARMWEGSPASDLAKEATLVAYESGEQESIVLALRTHAETLLVDRPRDAWPLLEQALTVSRSVGDAEAERILLVRMTDCALTLGDLAAAEKAHAQAQAATDPCEQHVGRGLAPAASQPATAGTGGTCRRHSGGRAGARVDGSGRRHPRSCDCDAPSRRAPARGG
ncbi:hypothetical protein ACQP1P_45570 [Dactylosporangium sp. CA-052675]|uniref:hypothetical protein n=1 Tax=Dactylosporangium sp. CA-052675 TaxID=3239927 RepID=UPI003D94C928